MAADPSVVEVRLESTLKSVEVAEDIVQRVCASVGFDEEDQHKISMAVHESMINAVAHGNKHDASKHVWLRFDLFADRLEVHVRDQGSGFEPEEIPDPLAAENLLRVSGRGIFLIRTFMDEMRIHCVPGSGTEVIMVKRIPQSNTH
jgi:serine/threonine-protein kinase RsbW